MRIPFCRGNLLARFYQRERPGPPGLGLHYSLRVK
jgi:hypothetical protein